MENLVIQGTKYTPEVVFDAGRSILEITGYSYPENAAAFYGPVMEWLHAYLEQGGQEPIGVSMELIYFNSSSSKILLDLFDLLDDYAEKRLPISVRWIYDAENESAYECGQEFEEDIEHLKFELKKKT